jgi:HSP20 family protein
MSNTPKKKSFFAKITGITKNEGNNKETNNLDELDELEAQAQQVKTQTTAQTQTSSNNWAEQNYEGQLSVDVYQTQDDIIIKSAVAGVDPKDLDISITNDMITIRGTRQQEEDIPTEDYYYQECYWGPFSRSIILPQEIKTDGVVAEFKKGILTIRLPKARMAQKIKIEIKEEN